MSKHAYYNATDSESIEPVKAIDNEYSVKLKEYQSQISEYRKIVNNNKVSGAERQKARDAIVLINKKILELPTGEVTTNEVKAPTIANKVYIKKFKLSNNHYVL